MSVNNNSSDSNVYNLIKQSLDAASLRSKVSANNIANLNTKDYKAKYVSFEDALNDSIGNLQMKTTDARHINITTAPGGITIKTDNTSNTSTDGNNVDIDNEMLNQATNNLMYNAMITRLNTKLSENNYVINGGK